MPAMDMPPAWTTAIPSTKHAGLFLPQAIAHRGFKARYAENTLAAFRGAVRAGAHALETDVRLTRDGVAVLSHDATLERCFGVRARVAERAWKDVAALRTRRDGRLGMPRLCDLLAWMVGREGFEGDEEGEEVGVDERRRVWVLLDIKMDDDPQTLVDAIATAISQVPPSPIPWDQRILLGCWNASTVRAARLALPSFSLAHIGVSFSYASHFLPAPASLPAFNLAYPPLLLRGTTLLNALRAARRTCFLWTLNDEASMRWALGLNVDAASSSSSSSSATTTPTISSSSPSTSSSPPSSTSSSTSRINSPTKPALVDAVISDDPALFLAVCARCESDLAAGRPVSAPPPRLVSRRPLAALRRIIGLVTIQMLITAIFLYRRFWLNRLDYMNEAAQGPPRRKGKAGKI